MSAPPIFVPPQVSVGGWDRSLGLCWGKGSRGHGVGDELPTAWQIRAWGVRGLAKLPPKGQELEGNWGLNLALKKGGGMLYLSTSNLAALMQPVTLEQ